MIRILIVGSNRIIVDAMSRAFGIFLPQAEIILADRGNAVEKFLSKWPNKVIICESGCEGGDICQEVQAVAVGTPAIVLRLGFINGECTDSKKMARVLKKIMAIIG